MSIEWMMPAGLTEHKYFSLWNFNMNSIYKQPGDWKFEDMCAHHSQWKKVDGYPQSDYEFIEKKCWMTSFARVCFAMAVVFALLICLCSVLMMCSDTDTSAGQASCAICACLMILCGCLLGLIWDVMQERTWRPELGCFLGFGSLGLASIVACLACCSYRSKDDADERLLGKYDDDDDVEGAVDPLVTGSAWYYETTQGWEPFNDDCQDYVEANYQRYLNGQGPSEVMAYTEGAGEVAIDFDAMTSQVVGSYTIRNIQRFNPEDVS